MWSWILLHTLVLLWRDRRRSSLYNLHFLCELVLPEQSANVCPLADKADKRQMQMNWTVSILSMIMTCPNSILSGVTDVYWVLSWFFRAHTQRNQTYPFHLNHSAALVHQHPVLNSIPTCCWTAPQHAPPRHAVLHRRLYQPHSQSFSQAQ